VAKDARNSLRLRNTICGAVLAPIPVCRKRAVGGKDDVGRLWKRIPFSQRRLPGKATRRKYKKH